ncbi:hypothetical protein ACOSP7_028314 [Xanthoceras sorbifolium]
MVRGQLIFMSVGAINEYFRLETDTTLVDGLAPHPNFTHYNEELAKDLWSSGEPTWNSRNSILRHVELRFTHRTHAHPCSLPTSRLLLLASSTTSSLAFVPLLSRSSVADQPKAAASPSDYVDTMDIDLANNRDRCQQNVK